MVQTVYVQRSNQCFRALTSYSLREEDPEIKSTGPANGVYSGIGAGVVLVVRRTCGR